MSERRSYDNVILVERVLAVLQAANRLPTITVDAVSRECSIPPSSVIRILETLCAEGFLVHVSRRGGYLLTSKVRSLSCGFFGTPLVVEVLRTFADDLTRKHLWPMSVATLDRDAMVIQYSSIPLSPLAHVRTTLHKRLSLVSRAHGLAYLSFCSGVERHRLLKVAASAARPEDAVISNGHDWRRLIRQSQMRGYAVRASKLDPFTCTIAVPVMSGRNRVIATFGMTFFRSVVREPQIHNYAEALRSAAAMAAPQLEQT
jgi:IclR family mhp operon transcriptional activator